MEAPASTNRTLKSDQLNGIDDEDGHSGSEHHSMARNGRDRAPCGCLLGSRAVGIGDTDPDVCLVARFDQDARALDHAGSDPDVDAVASFDADARTPA